MSAVLNLFRSLLVAAVLFIAVPAMAIPVTYGWTSGTITVSADHEDYFTRRLVAIMAEQREACVVLRPESFVSGTFDAAPTV